MNGCPYFQAVAQARVYMVPSYCWARMEGVYVPSLGERRYCAGSFERCPLYLEAVALERLDLDPLEAGIPREQSPRLRYEAALDRFPARRRITRIH